MEQARAEVQTMVETGRTMFAAATAYLLENEILSEDLKRLDTQINEGEQKMRRAVLEHLTMRPERDLVFSLKLISIVHEAERIGDLSKSLAKMADLAHKPRLGPLVSPLRSIRDDVLGLFNMIHEGFFKGNPEEARNIMTAHESLKLQAAQYITEVANQASITPNEAVVYAMSARMLSRVSSHLANIASTVVSPLDQMHRAPAAPEAP
ncbi:MAG: PhoU domain-containing protein [Rhodothermales bacterium]